MRVSSVALRPASAVPLDLVAGLLGRAFADAPMPAGAGPAAFSARTLDATVARDDILLDSSYVATVDGAPAGVALVAARPARGGPRTRLAGMGVVREARRAGVARALLGRVVADARGRGSLAVVLEVFEGNRAAVRLYEGGGFVASRRLLGFSLPIEGLPADDPPIVTLRPVAAPVLLPLFDVCASEGPAEAAPPWQLEAVSLARLGPSAAVYAIVERGGARPAGYVALTGEGPGARLVGLGIVPARRRLGLAARALGALGALYPDIAALSLAPLVPERSTLVPFLVAVGAAPVADGAQVEMVAHL
jgi:GNAT superfamily N-acetyltransferase